MWCDISLSCKRWQQGTRKKRLNKIAYCKVQRQIFLNELVLISIAFVGASQSYLIWWHIFWHCNGSTGSQPGSYVTFLWGLFGPLDLPICSCLLGGVPGCVLGFCALRIWAVYDSYTLSDVGPISSISSTCVVRSNDIRSWLLCWLYDCVGLPGLLRMMIIHVDRLVSF